MTLPLNLGYCCGTSMPGLRKITLPDGDQVGLFGLDAVMEELYKEGKPPNDETAIEIIVRLREKNYISYNPPVEELYRKALLREYERLYQKKTALKSRSAKHE